MDHSTAELSQSIENWYIDRECILVDDSSGEKCGPVIVFECMDQYSPTPPLITLNTI